MSKTSRTAARLAQQQEAQHADITSAGDIAALEQQMDVTQQQDAAVADGAAPPAAEEARKTADQTDRLVIGLSQITELMEQLPAPRDLLGDDMTRALKIRGVDLFKASMQMASYDVGRMGLAYEYNGTVIVRGMGRFMQSAARMVLAQAYYALRQAVREYRRFELLDQSQRLARQTDWQQTRPGQAEDGVSEASWVDGDDRYDPSRQQADKAQRALEEALPFVAAAHLFCERVPGLTDDEPVTTSVKKAAKAEPQARPETAADRMRKARGWVQAEAADAAAAEAAELAEKEARQAA